MHPPPPNPDNAEAIHLLGIIALRAGQTQRAVQLMSRAIELSPATAKYHLNRGEANRNAGELDAAIADYRRAIELDPSYATAYYNLGIALRAKDRLDEAIDAYRNAIRLKPDYTKAHYNLANLLRARLANQPAEAAYRAAISIDSKYAQAWNNLGELLSEQMRIDEALACYSRAIELRPDHANARFNRSFARLLRGEYEEAWTEYEWRWRTADQKQFARSFTQPQWDGSDLAGRTILIHAEQGIGDTIQFVRYAPLVANRGGTVIVECPPAVAPLVRTVAGVSRVIAAGETLPAFDVHIPMLSLPMAFRTTLATIPATVPYLSVDPARREIWRNKLAPHRRALNVGIAWAGNPRQSNDRNRSASFEQLAPLAGLSDVRFFSLQKGPAVEQLRRDGCGLEAVDLSDELIDYADTAAAIVNLDVVISVCTSVAHLAAALAKPTLVMLCHNADWRWLLERSDSPWYPTMKLFRQTTPGDWSDVARRVREELLSTRPSTASMNAVRPSSPKSDERG